MSFLSIENINLIISYSTILLDVLVALLLVFPVVSKLSSTIRQWFGQFLDFLQPNILLLMFLLLFFAVASSLFYSEVVGYTPCKLCWYQRIFIFSLMFLFGLAVVKSDRSILDYTLLLAVIGGLIAAYHIYLQFFNSKLGVCSSESLAVSCGGRYIEAVSFVSIPVMSFSIFSFVIISSLYFNKSN